MRHGRALVIDSTSEDARVEISSCTIEGRIGVSIVSKSNLNDPHHLLESSTSFHHSISHDHPMSFFITITLIKVLITNRPRLFSNCHHSKLLFEGGMCD